MGKAGKLSPRVNLQSVEGWKWGDRCSCFLILQVDNFWRHSVSLLRKFQWNQIAVTVLSWLFPLHDLTLPHFCFRESSKLTAYTSISGSAFRELKLRQSLSDPPLPYPIALPSWAPPPTPQSPPDCNINTEN